MIWVLGLVIYFGMAAWIGRCMETPDDWEYEARKEKERAA